MVSPRICVSITGVDLTLIEANQAEADIFEVRIDLIGPEWKNLVKTLKKPWIACNRSSFEGGKGDPDDSKRIGELRLAVDKGASIVDLELSTPNLGKLLPEFKISARCLLSFHNFDYTPDFEILSGIVKQQIHAGADICKIVTTAREFSDNLALIKLYRAFPEVNLIAFAMGDQGKISRIMGPLCGGYLTYASLAYGKESAPGQVSLTEMRQIYQLLKL